MATRQAPPPLLLTKRLNIFLHQNLTPTITTLLLLTPDGKLLAYAADPPSPVTTLRTHGTVAASLYAIHSAGTDLETIDATLPPQPHPRQRNNKNTPQQQHQHQRPSPLAVTIQLESGTVLVIRRLQCSMLFVCMGPPPDPSSSTHNHNHSSTSRPSTAPPPHIQPLAGALTTTTGSGHQTPSSTSPPPPHELGNSPGSIMSAQTTASSVMFGAGTAGVMSTRRHAEELARWLDEKLGPLDIPPNGFGGPV